MHQDEVYDVPVGVELLASTEKCVNQVMYNKGKFISVQGHPEFTQDMVKTSLEARRNILPEDEFKDAMQRLENHDDGKLIMETFLRFLLEQA